MKMLSKYITYVLIVTSAWDYSFEKPIPGEQNAEVLEKEYMNLGDDKRTQRQVVQPKWLTNQAGTKESVDPAVHVTDQNLREAEVIRQTIQATIDSDTYAVDPNVEPPNPIQQDLPPQQVLHPQPIYTPQAPPRPLLPAQSPPPQQSPMFPMNFPTSLFQATVPTVPATNAPVNGNLMNEVQRRWLEFLEYSRKMWNAGA